MMGTLNTQQIENILQSQSICRLACTNGEEPYVVPLSYYYDGKYLYFQSLKGKKIEWMNKHPKVAIEVSIIRGIREYQSVLLTGEFEQLNGNVKDEARKKMHEEIYSLMSRSRIHPFGHNVLSEDVEVAEEKPFLFRVKILSRTGRCEGGI
jgi:nitroimidazol reductase NimA-like FMN-containing flavoprotein (pyridoxamine 5'-phosphate oxidase superfamily)